MDWTELSGILHPFFKWLHVIAGITWIGLLYFFNFINGHLAATYDADSKKKVVPELMPRALYWFRWGAAWTWFTGAILLYVIYWHGNLSMGETGGNTMFSEGVISPVSHTLILVTFLAVFLYDAFYKSSLGKNTRVATIISFLFVGAFLWAMSCYGSFAYRSYNIHLGAMFGTIMAFNVWFRIWPAQQKIITAIKDGNAPNADDVGLAGLRSKHNTYMSVPLIWTMINQHHVTWDGMFGLNGQVWLLILVALGWHIVFQLYKHSAKVKGF